MAAASQQAQWLAASLPQFSPLWEATDKQNAHWALCLSFAIPAEQNIGNIRPFYRIPGIGEGKWTSENEFPSRTAALRASKRFALLWSDKASEKGHMAVWAVKLSKADIGRFLRSFAGMEKEEAAAFGASWNGECFFSVMPILPEEEYKALLAPPAPKAARKLKGKKQQAEATAEAIAEQPEAEQPASE